MSILTYTDQPNNYTEFHENDLYAIPGLSNSNIGVRGENSAMFSV
jgi:hypothetical protein